MKIDYSKVEKYSNLLKAITQNYNKLSSGTILMISRLCKNSKQRETLSKELIALINQSATESEIMEYIKKLQNKNNNLL